jgi:hypothetical protein
MSNYYLKTNETIESGKDLTEQLAIALNIIALNAISKDDIRTAIHLREHVKFHGILSKSDQIMRILYASLKLTSTKSKTSIVQFGDDREKLVNMINWTIENE